MKLVVAGGTSFTDDYVASLQKYAWDRVIMTGYVYGEELAEFWTNARLVVLPSTMEGLSIALLEAVSYGKCVLISDIPENIEVMGKCAPRFQSRNVDDLEAQLRDLLAHPGTVEKYMAMTREQISRRFSWETIVAELETCYFEMASGRSTPVPHGGGRGGERSAVRCRRPGPARADFAERLIARPALSGRAGGLKNEELMSALRPF